MWRRIFIAVAILCGAAGGVLFALKSPRVAHNVEARLATLAREHLGVDLTIDEVSLELFPPALDLTGITATKLGDASAAERWVELHHVRVEVRPWPSAAGAVVIEHLELDGLRAEVDLSELALEASDEPADEGGLGVDIRNLLVWDARVAITHGDNAVRIGGLDLQLHPNPEGGRAITIDLPTGHARLDDKDLDFEIRAGARLHGSVDRPKTLEVERARMFLSEIALIATGEIALDEPERPMRFDVDGEVALHRLADILDGVPPLAGQAKMSAEVKTNPTDPSAPPLVRLEVAVLDAGVAGESLGDIELSGLYDAPRLTLESFRLVNRSMGTLTGSGAVELSEGFPLSFTARAHDASLPSLLAKVGLPGSWLRMGFTGDLQGTGQAIPLSIDAHADLRVTHFEILDRSHLDPEARAFLALPDAQVAGNVRVGTRRVTLSNLVVTRADTVLNVEGTLAYDPEEGLDLRAGGETVELGDVGPIAAVPMSGHGALAAAVEGPYTDVTISATAELDDFTVFEHYLGDTKATLIYDDLRLQIDRMGIRRGRGSITGSGRFRFDTAQPTVEGAFEFENVALADLVESAGAAPSQARRFDATTRGRLLVGGALEFPEGVLSLSTPELAIDGAALGPMLLEGGFGSADDVFWGTVDLAPAGGHLDGSIALHRPERDGSQSWTVELDSRAVPLSALRPFMGDIPVTGSLTAQAKLAGPIDALSGPVQVSVKELVAWDAKLGNLKAWGATTAGRMQLEGVLLDKKIGVVLSLDLGQQLPYTATADLRGVNVVEVYPLAAQLGLSVSGTIFSQGDLTRPQTITADIQIPDGLVSWQHLRLRPARPIRIQLADGVYDIIDLALLGPGLQLSVGGRAPVGRDLELKLIAKGDLAMASAMSDAIQLARGPFEAELAVTGPWADPAYTGVVTVESARIRMRGLQQAFEQVALRAIFSGRDIEIRSGTARLEQGTIRFGGEITSPEGEPARLNLRAAFGATTLRPSPDLTVTATGELNLVGPSDDLLLKGDVTIERLRYVKNLQLDLKSLLPRRDAPLRVPSLAGDEATALRVRVRAPGNVHITGNQLEAELQADLMVTGTTERIGAIGTITPLTARGRWGDRLFDVTRASIDLVEEYRILAQFDLTATTRACDMDITVNVQGDSDSELTISPTAKDENGPVDPGDALSCLQIGMRMSDLAANDAASQQNVQWSVLGGLMEVSGVDQQLRRVFPIDLDEIRLTSGRSPKSRQITPRIVLSKDIGTNVQLKYNGSLSEPNDHIVSVEYEVSTIATLEGSWVSVDDVPVGDLGLDLRLRWEFQ